VEENFMQFVLMIHHGPTPTLPGSDRRNALPKSKQKTVYADRAALNQAASGATPGLPLLLGLPDAARTV
jgi:hypothetical protein